MSTYNGARFLEAQLESLAAQAGVECELFVRDDGSTDETRQILSRWVARWPRLADVSSGPNLGPANSFLRLLETVPGDYDYYAFCDQDDVWLPGKLARAAERLAPIAPSTPALYCSQIARVDAELKPLSDQLPSRPSPTFEHLLFENIAVGVSVVMNPAARVKVVARLPETGAAMHDWWCALVSAAFGVVVYDPSSFVLYRQHGGNAIGGHAGPLGAGVSKLRAFFRNPTGFHPIHAQAKALMQCFGDELKPEDRRSLQRLIESKRSLGGRLAYAVTGRVVRSRWTDGAFLRGLILAGWY